MRSADWSILVVFSSLSLLAFGGGGAVLPEMKRALIDQHHWLTDTGFRDVYSIAQLAPGPNMLLVVVVGYRVGGVGGALLAFLAFFLPASLLIWAASRVWSRYAASPWHLAVQRGMAPVVIGLMAAGVIAVGKTAVYGERTAILAAVAFFVFMLAKKVNPAFLVLAGGVIGVLLMAHSS